MFYVFYVDHEAQEVKKVGFVSNERNAIKIALHHIYILKLVDLSLCTRINLGSIWGPFDHFTLSHEGIFELALQHIDSMYLCMEFYNAVKKNESSYIIMDRVELID
jgi:hypothetical protein